MRHLLSAAALLLAACASAPPPVERPKPDPTKEAWYPQIVEQVADLGKRAAGLLARGKRDDAAALVTEAQPLIDRVLAAPRPTLAAMEAASDVDQLYGEMLMANHRYGWARLVLQKNVTRWKTWKPETAETKRRLKLASSAIAECDRQLEK